MSAKRSWDVRPNIVRPQQAPPRETPARGTKGTLKERREKARKRVQLVALVAGALVLGLMVAFLWQPFVRIGVIESEGPHAEGLVSLTTSTLEGTYFFIVPRDSIFFYPELEVRTRILKAHPDVVAVSVSRAGFQTLHVKSVPRTSAFTWCGASAHTPEPCYEADAEGLVFAAVPGDHSAPFADAAAMKSGEVASSTEPDLSILRVYAPLAPEEEDDGTPLKARVMGAESLPDALRFVKAMKLLNVGIVSVEIRGDEADLYTPEGTRITYILGKEVEAAALAASAFPTLALNDGSLEYVDLRFEGKVYLKRRGME